ncbi:FlgD immunoglobulin-like domain containing protein, partial [bacterium]
EDESMKVKVIVWLGVLCFMSAAILIGQGHGDPFEISVTSDFQGFAQVEYNPNVDVYLVAWEDMRVGNYDTDIYGQLIKGDGTLIGSNFSLCDNMAPQYWPRIAVDPVRNLFLVVFEDQRNGGENGDVRGVFVDTEGNLVDAPTSDADHSFGICTNDAHIYTCSVVYNYLEEVYLVVWGDNRNNPEFNYGCVDVYGQLVGPDGTLMTPADPTVNFAIDMADWYEASVPDVTYNDITNEFYVVYGSSIGYVLGQRVDHQGQLINPKGTTSTDPLAKSSKIETPWPAMFLSEHFDNGPDCLQTRVASRTEYHGGHLEKSTAATETSVQVVWKGMHATTPAENFNDGWGQRVGFFWEVDKYITKYISLTGDTSYTIPSNFPLSLQPDWIEPLDIAYSAYDDEFMVAWGDPRDANGGLYTQRLWINDSENMIFLADDRVNTVTETENNPIATTELTETSLLGVAHNPNRNEFLCAYVQGNTISATGLDIFGIILNGTEPPPSDIASRNTLNPDEFGLNANYPNPFNPSTTISFQLPKTTQVTVTVYDLQGKNIATLLEQSLTAGKHQVQWDGRNDAGNDVASGVYFYKVHAGQNVKSSKMTLLR